MKKTKEINLYAVYGTLKEGHGNHRVMGDSKLLGTTLTRPSFSLYNLFGFPGLKEGGDTAVEIEVYEVIDAQTASNIDRLEGYSGTNHPHNLYNKIEIETEFGKAFVYIYNRDINSRYEKIENGKY